MNTYLNVAFYKFVELSNLPELRSEFKDLCLKLNLRGSILLSQEGINAFLAGTEDSIRQVLSHLRSRSEFKDLEAKESWTTHIPFKRMLVKIKKEIIAMGQPDIYPALSTGARLSAQELKTWLDEKRDVVLLDTRNDYEISEGTFENAIDFNLKTFKQFPDQLQMNKNAWGDRPVVMFCTGGIRCEKATALALQYGMKNVYQLEGGILKYFEEVGSAHYRGECFVFDGRISVDGNLSGAVDRQTKRRVSGIHLYSYRRCPFAIRARMVLEEKNLPYITHEENLAQPSAELLSLNPHGQVPVLVHQGRIIYESSIITEYLDEEFPQPRLMPLPAEERARVRLWTHWCDQVFKPDVDLYKYEYAQMQESDQFKLVERMDTHLHKLQRSLKKHRFLLSEEFTLADIHVFPFYRQLTKIADAEPQLARFPVIREWLESVMDRPSFSRVMRIQQTTKDSLIVQPLMNTVSETKTEVGESIHN